MSDKIKRQKYDQFGFNGPQSNFNGFDMHDFMRNHGSMFSDFFEDFGMHFGFNSFNSDKFSKPDFNLPEDGRNVQVNITIPFKDMVFGCEKTFDLKLTKECPKCHGTGINNSVEPKECSKCNGTGHYAKITRNGFMVQQVISECPACHGIGFTVEHCKKCHGDKRIEQDRHISVNIPQSIENGQKLRILNAGHCGVNGGKNGHLYINVFIEPQNVFERDELNLKTQIFIDPITASIGGKSKVASPYGLVDIDIPANMQTGCQLTLKKHGLKRQSATGDLIVEVIIEAFSHLSDNQKKQLEKLKTEFNSENLPKSKVQLDNAMKIFN